MNSLLNTNVAIETKNTPFARGFNVVLFNNSGAAATLTGSDDGVTYANVAGVVAVATGTMTNVPSLPRFIKMLAAGATIYLLGRGV